MSERMSKFFSFESKFRVGIQIPFVEFLYSLIWAFESISRFYFKNISNIEFKFIWSKSLANVQISTFEKIQKRSFKFKFPFEFIHFSCPKIWNPSSYSLLAFGTYDTDSPPPFPPKIRNSLRPIWPFGPIASPGWSPPTLAFLPPSTGQAAATDRPTAMLAHPPRQTKGHHPLLSSNRHERPIPSSSKRNRRDWWSTHRRPLKAPWLLTSLPNYKRTASAPSQHSTAPIFTAKLSFLHSSRRAIELWQAPLALFIADPF
jgi:hypothetical protein